MGKSNNTTTTQTTPNPVAQYNYLNLLGRAQDVTGANPWQDYSGEFVAPVNQQQYAGIGGINRYAEAAQPYIQTAGGLALSGATPISAGDIQNYYNPWQQNVVGATQAQFANMNAQQQQQVLGNAAAQGALGGDRTAVAQANLAGQQQLAQAPVIAGLQSQGFNQAAQLALAAKQQQAQGAYSLGNLGVAGQQAGLSGAGAQIQAGTLEQQNRQQLDAALYNQFLMSRAFPYQQMQWLAGIDTGVGSQMGGTSQTTGPSPSWLSQLLGLTTAGVGAAGQAGAFKNTGGRIAGFADGGAPIARPLFGGVGYIPSVTITRGAGAPKPPGTPSQSSQAAAPKSPFQPWMFKGSGTTDANAGISPDPLTGSYAPEAGFGDGPIYADGGPVTAAGFGMGSRMPQWPRGYEGGGEVRIFAEPEEQHGYMPALPLTGGPGPPGSPKAQSPSSGGGGGPSIPWGQIAGGVGSALAGLGSVAGEALGGAEGAGAAGAMLAVLGTGGRIRGYDEGGEVIELPPDQVPTEVPAEAIAAWRQGVDQDVTRGASPQPVGGFGPPSELPPEIVAGTSRPEAGAPLALGYDQEPTRAPVAGVGAASPSVADDIIARYRKGLPAASVPRGRGEVAPWSSPESNLWPSLMAAGFGMMASKSPFPGVAIGQGGLQGLHTYQGLGQQQRAEAMSQQKVQMVADNLVLQADRAQKELALHTKQFEQRASEHGQTFGLHKEQFEETKRQHREPFGWTRTDDGRLVPTPGGPHDPEQMKKEAEAKGEMWGPFVDISTGKQWLYNKRTGEFREPATGTPPKPGQAPVVPVPVVPDPPTSQVPSSPTQVGNAPPGPVRVASADPKLVGIIGANSALIASGQPYDYSRDGPYIEKGMGVPEPGPVVGKSAQTLKTDAEYFLQTGKLPPLARGDSATAIIQNKYRNAVQNYGNAVASSRGMTPDQVADMWRTAPGMLRFVLGADGRSTVALGTAVRHLDTLKQLADAWKEGSTIGNWQTWNRVTSAVRREFGDAAVTNLESAARIVGPEIIKGLGVAGAGTEHDRNTASGQFLTGKGIDQIYGAIATTQKLLGGQLEGRERQAANAGVSPERFKSLIGERPYEVLKNADKGGGAAAPAPAGKPTTVIQNGHTYTLQPDGTYR